MKKISNHNLTFLNTFGIPSVAGTFIELQCEQDYEELLASSMLDDMPFFVLGGGSNVILPDRYEGIVVHPRNKGIKLLGSDENHCLVEAQAGELWPDFVDCCIANGWYGVENLAGIPGTVGAAPVQNVGAYGKEAKDVIDCVHFFDTVAGEGCWLRGSDCQFGYRTSIFKTELSGACLVDRVVFRLNTHFLPDLTYAALASALQGRGIANPSARQLADTVIEVRDSKLPDPKTVGSAGSFFKNPVVDAETYRRIATVNPNVPVYKTHDSRYKIPAGWLIEQCGWKGRSLGNVGVYEKQALVLVNRGGCNGNDVRRLADTIIADVRSRFCITLECEAIFVK